MKLLSIITTGLLYLFLFAGAITLNTKAEAKIVSLNGHWKFAIDTSGVYSISDIDSKASWRNAKVPLSWQAQFEDLRDYQGVAWYKKTISISRINPGEIVLIKFEAVDYFAEVYVNGKPAGKHEGGYTPFEFDITDLATKNGELNIVLRVMDPLQSEKGTEGISYYNIPHGKQNWYVQTSGIWRDASVEIKPERYIEQVHITPLINGDFSAEIKLNTSKKNPAKGVITFNIFNPKGKSVFSKSVKSDDSIKILGKINKPLLWNIDSPELYRLEVSLNGKDKYVDRFGFRQIEAHDKMLYLNGKPFYLMAALDQDFYPDEIYTTPSEEYLRDEMLKAKQTGLNMLRCHIKVPDRRYLKIADEVGLLVWYEIPNWDVFTPDAARRGMETFDKMLARDWNHPSLVIMSIINESWGIDLQKPEQRSWLKEAFDAAKIKASGRLVVDNSACWGNFHLKTDINDYHTYYSIPDNRKQFVETVSSVAGRPAWLFSKFGDAEQKGDEPLLISEFGNWGLPKLPEKLPFWFKRQFLDDWITIPEGVYKRFKDNHYDETFGSYNDLADVSQHAQLMMLKYEIEQIRLHPEIQGYVITEFTDINWESNGLMDMWRNLKVSAKNISDIQQQDVIIPIPDKYNHWQNETARINLKLSHYSNKDLSGAKLLWQASNGEKGSQAIAQIKNHDVTEVPAISLVTSGKDAPQKLRVDFEVVDSQGKRIAKNYTEIFSYPQKKPLAVPVVISNDDMQLKKFADGLLNFGYRVKSSSDDYKGQLIITNNPDNETIKQQMNAGAYVICLVDTNTKAPAYFPYKFIRRTADWYDGNWASNLNWIRSERSPFKEISFGKYLGFESAYASPQIVISEIPAGEFSDVLSGMYIGWLHLNSGYVLQTKAGNGRLLFCTLPLSQGTNDPYSVTLLGNLIQYISGKDYNAQISLNIK